MEVRIHTILYFVFSLSTILFGQSSIAAPVVFEDFSSTISLDKYPDTEQNIELDTINQNLILSQKGSSHFNSGKSNSLSLVNQNIEMLQADLTVTELTLGNMSTQQAFVRFGGYFYKTALGNIWATLHLGDRGNGLEAWYEIFEEAVVNNTYTTFSFVQGSLATGLSLNTTYTSSIDFDNNNAFTFVFNGGSPVIATGPSRVDFPDSLFKFVGTRIRFGGNNSTPADLEDVSPDDGTSNSISAKIDNVITNLTSPNVLDDFSTADMDLTKWKSDEGSITVLPSNQLKIIVKRQTTGQTTKRLHLRKHNLDYIGAKVTLLSDSVASNTARVRGRIIHYLGNHLFDTDNGDVPNGDQGNIFTQLTLEKRESGLWIFAYASKVLIEDFNNPDGLPLGDVEKSLFPSPELISLILPNPINYDIQYELAIEKIGTVVNYKVDNVVYHSLDLASHPLLSGNVYPVTNNASTSIQARVHSGPGEAHVIFDDIITDDENRKLFTRAEIAKPLLQAIYGKSFVPPLASGTPYDDVSVGDFNADWIEKLAADGITEGCAAGRFCPDMVVTKEQLSKLLLKTKNGSSYMPASPTGTVFNDISIGSIDADWIEELANQAISAGCDTDNFCRYDAVTIATVEAMADRALP